MSAEIEGADSSPSPAKAVETPQEAVACLIAPDLAGSPPAAAQRNVSDITGSLGGTTSFPNTKIRPYRATNSVFIPRVDNNDHVPGTSLKYSEWWITTTAIHAWTIPTSSSFQRVTLEVVGGGGAGGTSSAAANCSVGAGGCGGAWGMKTIALADIPTAGLTLIVGKGGTAGGWGGTVSGTVPNAILTSVGNGGNAAFSAVLDTAVWTALGADDFARLGAVTNSNAILFCDGGQGGIDADDSHFTETDGLEALGVLPLGARAYGGDINRLGAPGAGGGTSASELDSVGAGGAAGSYQDALWDTVGTSRAGIVGRLAGGGGQAVSLISSGGDHHYHDGHHGGLYGGGGSGGFKIDSTNTDSKVSPGGFGAPGAIDLFEDFD
jgi:hypothetical protein